MKSVFFGMSTLGIGGAALTGAMSGHDVSRTIAKPPAEVYAALSAVAVEGDQSEATGNGQGTYTLRVKKDPGNSIHYEMLVDGKSLGEVEFEVEAEAEGAGTTLNADIEIDKGAIAAKLGGVDPTFRKLAAVPDVVITLGLSKVVDQMKTSIENGVPLSSLTTYKTAAWYGASGASRAESSYAAQGRQSARAAPMMTARPMVDPDASARKFMRNNPSSDGY